MQFQYLFSNPKKKKGKKKGKKVMKRKVAKKVGKKKSSKRKVAKKIGKKKSMKKSAKKAMKKAKKKVAKAKSFFVKKRRIAKKKTKRNPIVRTMASGKKHSEFTKGEINKVYSLSDQLMKAKKKIADLKIREKNVQAKKRHEGSLKRIEKALGQIDVLKSHVISSNAESEGAKGSVKSSKMMSDARYDMITKEADKAIKSAGYIHIAPKSVAKSAKKAGKKSKEELRAIRLKALEKARQARKAKAGKKKTVKKASKKVSKKVTKSEAKSKLASLIAGSKKKVSKKVSKKVKKKASKKVSKKSTKGKKQKHQKHSKPNRKLPMFSLSSIVKKLPLPTKKGKTRNMIIGNKKFKVIRLNPSGGNMEVKALADHKMVGKAYQALNKFSNMATKHEFLEVTGMATSASLMGLVDRALLNAPAVGGVYNTMRSYGGIGVASYVAGLLGCIATEMGAKKLSGDAKMAMEALHQMSRGVISAGIVNMWQTLLAPELGMAGLVQTNNMNGLVQTMNGADFGRYGNLDSSADFGRLVTHQNMNGLVQTMNGADFEGLVQTMNGADFEGLGHEEDVYDYGVMSSEGEDYHSGAYDVNGNNKASVPSAYDVDGILSGVDFE
jgi:hypothetical protein